MTKTWGLYFARKMLWLSKQDARLARANTCQNASLIARRLPTMFLWLHKFSRDIMALMHRATHSDKSVSDSQANWALLESSLLIKKMVGATTPELVILISNLC